MFGFVPPNLFYIWQGLAYYIKGGIRSESMKFILSIVSLSINFLTIDQIKETEEEHLTK